MSKQYSGDRREVLYAGRVQGVGFRFRTRAIAERFAVAGYVKNLTNGHVQLVIEGNSDELDRFLAEIAAEMRGNIHNFTVTPRPPTDEFEGFSIRH